MSVITKGFPRGMSILVKGFGRGGAIVAKIIHLVSKITKH